MDLNFIMPNTGTKTIQTLERNTAKHWNENRPNTGMKTSQTLELVL